MLVEARSATKQGQAVMSFTIVTVIFVKDFDQSKIKRILMAFYKLPLSLFTSYFGQNVSESTGDSKNPSPWNVWRIASESNHLTHYARQSD
jgi:hypothetical protein